MPSYEYRLVRAPHHQRGCVAFTIDATAMGLDDVKRAKKELPSIARSQAEANAAPSYLSAVDSHGHLMLDGGIWANNPIMNALLDRLTHHCHILETGNDSFRFRNRSAHETKTTKEKRGTLTTTTDTNDT